LERHVSLYMMGGNSKKKSWGAVREKPISKQKKKSET